MSEINNLINKSKKIQNDIKSNLLSNKSENLQKNSNELENKWNLVNPPFWNDIQLNNYVKEMVDDFFNQSIKRVNVLHDNKMKIDFVERNKIISRKMEKLRPSPIPKTLMVTKKKINSNLSSTKSFFPCRVLTRTDDEITKFKEEKNIKNIKMESTWHEVFYNRHTVETKEQALKNCKSNQACNTLKNVIFRGENEEEKTGETETIRKFIDQPKNCNIQMLPVMSIRGEILNSVQKLHKISITPVPVKKLNDEQKNIKYCQFIYSRDETINDGIDNRIQLDEPEIEQQKNLWNGKSNKNLNRQTETNPENFLFENGDNTDETIENCSKSYLLNLKDLNIDKIAPFSITVKENQNQIEKSSSDCYNSSFEKTISSISESNRKSKVEKDLRQTDQVNVLSDGSCQREDTNMLEKGDLTKQQV